jgi:hypothetical protein
MTIAVSTADMKVMGVLYSFFYQLTPGRVKVVLGVGKGKGL